MKEKTGFKIYGQVVVKESGVGVPGLTVKAIDKDLLFDDLLGTVTTDAQGRFEIRYDRKDFQELFFDQRPDIYLKIRTPDGKEIFSTEEKVRYGAGTTEEFLVEIPADLLLAPPIVNWDYEASEQLKQRIATNEQLMGRLSETAAAIFKKHKMALGGQSYLFAPRVFELPATAAPDVSWQARKAMIESTVSQLFDRYESTAVAIEQLNRFWKIPPYWFKCLPMCGIWDPFSAVILEKYRLPAGVIKDPTPEPSVPATVHPSLSLMRKIVGNKALLGELSEALFGVLKEGGVTFKDNQGCVFTPVVFETPVYAQVIGEFEQAEPRTGFGPQIFGNPDAQPALRRPTPGIVALTVDAERYLVPALNYDMWWWEGIPAPELLRAMDVLRQTAF